MREPGPAAGDILPRSMRFQTCLLGIALAAVACAGEIRVMTSGGFTAAYRELAPQFEKATGNTVLTAFGASMGGAPDSIPSRLNRNEPVDVVILASAALDDLIRRGKVTAEGRVDLVRSSIGMAVRAGAPRPDISSLDALKQTLLAARSIAYSDSASGVYLSTELFPRLALADQITAKTKKTTGMVGEAVARGDAEIGFQQVSELLSVKGIDFVGLLPPEVQRITVFSAGIAVNATNPAGARALIQFLASESAIRAILRTGLEPMGRVQQR